MPGPRLVALIIAAAAWSAAAPARAERKPTPEVRGLVERAQRHFDLAEYDKAIAGFSKAYRLDPRPALLFNLAQAYRLAGDCVRAARMYRNFLRLAPGSRHRPLARTHLKSVEDCEREQISNRPEPLSTESLPAPDAGEPVAPPPPPSVEETPVPEAPTPVASGGGRNLRLAGLATVSAGAVGLLVGTSYAIDASSAADEVSQGYRNGATWAELAEIDARGRRSETLGAAFLVGGGLAVATGAALYYLGHREGERTTAIVPRDGGGQVVMTWAF